jgi:hypothetical protein
MTCLGVERVCGASGSAIKGIASLLSHVNTNTNSPRASVVSVGYDQRLYLWNLNYSSSLTDNNSWSEAIIVISPQSTESNIGIVSAVVLPEESIRTSTCKNSQYLSYIHGDMVNVGDVNGIAICSNISNDSYIALESTVVVDYKIVVVGEGFQIFDIKI